MLLADFTRLPPITRGLMLDGLSGAIDLVARRAPETHRFLRYQWFAAALTAFGGSARTILIERDGDPVIALPMIRFGPAAARLAAVPGNDRPFRSFPADANAHAGAFDALVDQLGDAVNALRIGPASDGDPAVAQLLAAARAKGWATLDRFVADSHQLDLRAAQAAGGWPRPSTLHRNRFYEKHLADRGLLDWHFLDGAVLAAGGFAELAAVEEKSGAASNDGRHAFWEMVAADPMLAGMLWAALLTVNGTTVAWALDLHVGAVKYPIAGSDDPAFAHHAPGRLLYYRNLARAAEVGIGTVDWGIGKGHQRAIDAETGPAVREWLLLRPGLPAVSGRVLRGLWQRSAPRVKPDNR